MNVFLSQDFLTVIHDMKFPGYQKFPFLQESPGFFTGMPLRTIISVITPSLSASRLQGEVLLLVFGDNSFLDIKNQTGSFYSGRYPGNLRKIFPYSCCNF